MEFEREVCMYVRTCIQYFYSETSVIQHLYNSTLFPIQPSYEAQAPSMLGITPQSATSFKSHFVLD